jgi:hypothetical protein
VADLEGVVRRLRLTPAGLDHQRTVTIFDAGAGRCRTGTACQPISVSPALMKRTTPPLLLALVATGGVDWARDTATPSYLLGFDAAAGSQVSASIAHALGSLTRPAVSAPGGVALSLPLRVYAQPTVAGQDLYLHGTTLALGSVNQLLLPLFAPGSYGSVLRWNRLSSALDITPVNLTSPR